MRLTTDQLGKLASNYAKAVDALRSARSDLDHYKPLVIMKERRLEEAQEMCRHRETQLREAIDENTY